MSNYYNEYDPKAAEWLRQLIKAGLIPDGDVDERSITEINANELYPYTQCHFFAGIGGWSLALQLAGWPADKPVWTGSCPCQPFSIAGKGLAQKDERHLWPAFFDLIRECRPDTVFGEQVASAIGHGWLDGISSDLESEGYACGSAVLGAHSVSAPHIRQRLYWVADSGSKGLQRHGQSREQPMEERWEGKERHAWTNSSVQCRDGKSRRVPTEPAFQPLAQRVPARVVRLRGYGNAIVPQVAAAFIEAFTSTLENTPTHE
jgi:DNA (cytosine-5)-methyltransferase 1